VVSQAICGGKEFHEFRIGAGQDIEGIFVIELISIENIIGECKPLAAGWYDIAGDHRDFFRG
jgi:hypothetical protein